MLAVPSRFKPRIGRSRTLSLPWSSSHRLFSDWPVSWNAPGMSSSITLARPSAGSMMTFTDARRAASADASNFRAEEMSLCPQT
jgi:hypothetical protein